MLLSLIFRPLQNGSTCQLEYMLLITKIKKTKELHGTTKKNNKSTNNTSLSFLRPST